MVILKALDQEISDLLSVIEGTTSKFNFGGMVSFGAHV